MAKTKDANGKFIENIGSSELRKMRSRRDKSSSIWFGLGTMGMIGWSVAVPTLIGVAIGIWLDIVYPGHISWVIAFLFAGLAVGCANAWYWVERENERKLREDRTMNEYLLLILSLASGIFFGLFYFGGLWLTLKHISCSKQPAFLVACSFLVRSMVCLSGFYLISSNGLEAIAFCISGFMLSKLALINRLNPHARAEADYG